MPIFSKDKKMPPVIAQKAAAKNAAGAVMTKADRSQVRAILQKDATLENGEGGAKEEATLHADNDETDDGS